MPDTSTGVVVIGGGSTGAGVLRDLALRGIDAILVEKGDLASGTTGRSHGLLHSGGRYCVNDEQAAIECVQEGRILRRIARSTVEDTGGYFVSVTEEDHAWEPRFVEGCRRTGISCERISVGEARRREPALSKHVRTVFWVPEDGHLDPFYLVVGNVESARRRGGRVMTHTEVSGFLRDGDRLTGVRIRDSKTREEGTIACQSVINATGAWAGLVARLLGVEVKVVPVKGTMVVLSRRLAHAAINRCHKPGDGDIVVPGLSVSILGTTSAKVPHPETLPIEWDEVRHMIEEGAMMLDGVTTARAMRAYAGVRPLYDLGAEAEGREMSRNFAVIDHQERDGIKGFTSIVGGKVTTFRLMAERVVDVAARHLGVSTPCSTAEVPLNDRDEPLDQLRHRPSVLGVPKPHGDERPLQPLLCECELVRPQDVAPWFKDAAVRDLEDVRRRTRSGMGPCQAAICSYRLAARLVTDRGVDGPTATRAMADFLETRWRGVRHVFWGSQLRNMQVTTGLHMELYNVDRQLMLDPVAGTFPPPLAVEGQGGGTAPEPAQVTAQR
ncbi:MAG TPA: anaerobic glycerol-3-phosphate dehydrogenase subunit GlpA [Candidatus Dormibacteraeota bacterium]|nr:anaerobic glycerol-3-phosphate dehydrogenase subunit GlpA [Candidatus Dormibacteraeota bacterium]